VDEGEAEADYVAPAAMASGVSIVAVVWNWWEPAVVRPLEAPD
jgi:hypothetical protein